jgi:hypothetical protein
MPKVHTRGDLANRFNALSVWMVAMLLSSCSAPSGTQYATVPLAKGMTNQMRQRLFSPADSRALPEAKGKDLLYVSSNDRGIVYVYTYPEGKIAETLTGLENASGECTDPAGDVFITSYGTKSGTIYEYAHGGKKPLAALSDQGQPFGCSIDPATGNLAVANGVDYSNPYCKNCGDVAIYTGAKGNAKIYYSSDFGAFWFCGYDNGSNLYLSAFDEFAGSQLVRLANGSSSFEVISLNAKLYTGLYFQPSVQWDGKHMTVSSAPPKGMRGPVSVYQLSISGSSGTVIGTTELTSPKNNFEGQTWIEGDAIIGSDETPLGKENQGYRSVSFWRYPQGGRPRQNIIKVGDERNIELWGVAVSPGSSH